MNQSKIFRKNEIIKLKKMKKEFFFLVDVNFLIDNDQNESIHSTYVQEADLLDRFRLVLPHGFSLKNEWNINISNELIGIMYI